VPTVVAIWPTAGWPERECVDLFGIRFEDIRICGAS
jgi:NADH:ubiquinone oxidoreductase subunit C